MSPLYTENPVFGRIYVLEFRTLNHSYCFMFEATKGQRHNGIKTVTQVP